jgi:hypothetical protein
MGQATHEQTRLMLELYDLRREPRMRQARDWYFMNFTPASAEEMMQKFPPGSEESAFMRMVASYWDMVAAIANRGLVDEDLFFETTGEQWGVWERLKPIVGSWRAMFKNPGAFANLEEHVRRFEAWREKRAPGSNDAMRERMQQMMAMLKSQEKKA